MSRTNQEPGYRRRIREKAEKDQQTAETERRKSDNEYNAEKITSAINRVEQELDRTNDEQTPQKQRDRYWERFGFLGLWFAGFVGIAAIWVGTHDAGEQRGVMESQLREIHDEFVSTQRPWISVDTLKIFSPLYFLPNGNISLVLKTSLVNSGRTPGIYVWPLVIPVLLPTTGIEGEVLTKTHARCDEIRARPFSPSEGGVLVPPGRSIPYPFANSITIEASDIAKGTSEVRGHKAIVPYLGVCITYQFTFGEKVRHQTGYIYQLAGPQTFIFLGEEIPTNDLVLIEHAGAWAD